MNKLVPSPITTLVTTFVFASRTMGKGHGGLRWHSGFPPKPVVPPKAVRLGSARMTARGRVGDGAVASGGVDGGKIYRLDSRASSRMTAGAWMRGLAASLASAWMRGRASALALSAATAALAALLLATAALALFVPGTAHAQSLATIFATITDSGISNTDRITNSRRVNVTDGMEGAHVTFSVDAGDSYQRGGNFNADGRATFDLPNESAVYVEQQVLIRQSRGDTNSDSIALAPFTLDVTPPGIERIFSDSPDGIYKVGDRIRVLIEVDDELLFPDSPPQRARIAVDVGTGRGTNAGRITATATSAVLFIGTYTVRPGDDTARARLAQITIRDIFPGSPEPTDVAGNLIEKVGSRYDVRRDAFFESNETFTIDTIVPTVSNFGTITHGETGKSQTHRITFSEPVTGLAAGDFAVNEGVNVTGVSPSSGFSTNFNITFTPNKTEFTLALAPQSVSDRAVGTGGSDNGNRGPVAVAEVTGTARDSSVDRDGSVAISGTIRVGDTLTATVSDPDGEVTDITYQWQRKAAGASGDFGDIAGATSMTYTLPLAELGNLIGVNVEYTDRLGPNKRAFAETSGDVQPAPAPSTPIITLHEDTGFQDHDRYTKTGRVNVSGLSTLPGSVWRYSTNSDTASPTFTLGTGTFFTLPEGRYAEGSVRVVQMVLGTASAPAQFAEVTIDSTIPEFHYAGPDPYLSFPFDRGGFPENFEVTDNLDPRFPYPVRPHDTGAYSAGVPGTYTLTYEEFDRAGNIATLRITFIIRSTDASLSNLVFAPAVTLKPAFDAATFAYTTVEVAEAVASVTLTPTTTDDGATLTVNGTPVRSGEASQAITLGADKTTVTIVVAAEHDPETSSSSLAAASETETYTIVVSRAGPDLTAPVIALRTISGTGATDGDPSYLNAGDQLIVVLDIDEPLAPESLAAAVTLLVDGTVYGTPLDLVAVEGPNRYQAVYTIPSEPQRSGTLSLRVSGLADASGHVAADVVFVPADALDVTYILDTIPIPLVLVGAPSVNTLIGVPYFDSGVTGGTVSVVITDSADMVVAAVDTSAAGEYTYTYRATDQAGNVTTLTRRVTVGDIAGAPPAQPSVMLNADTAPADYAAGDSDRITMEGDLNVADLVPGATWEYSINSGGDWQDGSGTQFTVDEGVYTDDQVRVRQTRNGGVSAFAGARAFSVDVTPPTVATFEVPGVGTVGVRQPINLMFSEAVFGLEVGDFFVFGDNEVHSVAPGEGPATTYTIDYTPRETSFQLRLPPQIVFDLAGNRGPASTQNANGTAGEAADTTAPTVTTFDTPVVGLIGTAQTHPITFSEAVTDVEVGDFSTTGATVNEVTGAGNTRTITFTPNAETYTLTLDANSVSDRAAAGANRGPANPASVSGTAVRDIIPPTVLTFEDIATVGMLGESQTHPLTFSEAVIGLAVADFTTEGAEVNSIAPAVGPASTYTITFTPTAPDYTLTLAANAVMDPVGNTGPLRPLQVSGTTRLSARISDTGVSDSDRITNDNRLTVAGVGSGATWEYSVNSGSNWHTGVGTQFTVDEGTYADDVVRVRRLMDGVTSEFVGVPGFTLDTTPPDAEWGNSNAKQIGEEFSNRITFTEAVSGVDVAAFSRRMAMPTTTTTVGATVNRVTVISPSAYLVHLTPFVKGINVILYRGNIMDLAGNAGPVGTVNRQSVAFDNTPPTPSFESESSGGTVSGTRTFVNAGDTVTFEVSFNETIDTATLVGAAQFRLAGSDDPAPQDLLATIVPNRYDVVYRVRADDLGLLTITVSGVMDTSGMLAAEATYPAPSDPDFFADNTPPEATLVGAGASILLNAAYTPPHPGVTSNDNNDSLSLTVTNPNGVQQTLASGTVTAVAAGDAPPALDTSIRGIHTYTYTVSDVAGNSVVLRREIAVGFAPVLSFNHGHSRGSIVGGRVILSGGDTVRVNMATEALESASLVGAAQFQFAGSDNPPPQDITGSSSSGYRAEYRLQIGDTGAVTFKVSGVASEATGGVAPDITYVLSGYVADTTVDLALVGDADLFILPFAVYNEPDPGATSSKSGTTVEGPTIVGPGGLTALDTSVPGTYTYTYTVEDAFGNVATVRRTVVVGTAPDAPIATLNSDTGPSDSDRYTNDARLNVTGVGADATWQYSTDAGANWQDGSDTQFTGAEGVYTQFSVPEGVYTDDEVRVRLTLEGVTSAFAGVPGFTLDVTPPTAPTFAGTLFTPRIGVEYFRIIAFTEPVTDVELSDFSASHGVVLDSVGYTFTPEHADNYSVVFTLDVEFFTLTLAANSVLDLAGNWGPPTALTAIAYPVAPVLTLANDTGVSDSDWITSDGRVHVGLVANSTWEYSTDGGATWQDGSGTHFTLPEGFYRGGKVLARQTRLERQSGGGFTPNITIDSTPPVVTFDPDDLSSSGGTSTGGLLLNADDTLTVVVESNEFLADASLRRAVQFELSDSDNPPPQDLLRIGMSRQYQATYTVRDGDAGALTFTLSGVHDVAGGEAEELSVAIPGYTLDTALPQPTLLGAATASVALNAAYTPPHPGVETDTGDTLVLTLTRNGGSEQTLASGTPPALDTSRDGFYTYTYTVTDAAGNVAIVTRSVTVGTAEAPNTAPVIDRTNRQVNHPENTPAIDSVARYTALNTEGDNLTWSLGGTDAELFTLITIDPAGTTGFLAFKESPDFEDATDADGDGDYEIDITATDDGTPNAAGTLTVTVTLVNVEEAGAIGAIDGTPLIGELLTAGEITDPDGGVTDITYQWEIVDDDGDDHITLHGATKKTYLLEHFIGTLGNSVHVVATYNDGQGDDKMVTSAATDTITDLPTFLDFIASSVGGERGERTTHLNTGDTVAVRVEVNRELTAESLVGAVQFELSDSANPPPQDFVRVTEAGCGAAGLCIYDALYVVRDGDTGTPTFRVSGLMTLDSDALPDGVDVISAYLIDAIKPSATLGAIPEGVAMIGETRTTGLIFDEVVTDLELNDFATSSGLTVVSINNNPEGVAGMDYVIGYEVSATPFTLTLSADAVVDIASNTGPASEVSVTGYAMDTTKPTATFAAIPDDELVIGKSSGVTLTFDEAITGLSRTDISTEGARITGIFFLGSAGTDHSIIFTPTAATFTLTLAANSVSDRARPIANSGPDMEVSVTGTATPAVALPTDATLSALSLTRGDPAESVELSPAFASDTEGYTASVPRGTADIRMTATTNHADASVTITAPSATLTRDGAASAITGMAVGEHIITIIVTSADGSATKTYTVTVTRVTAPEVQTFASPAAGVIGERQTVEITFTERVTDVDAGDFSGTSGATVHNVVDTGDQTTYTITFTPTATSFTLLLTLNSVLDLNRGPGPFSASGNSVVGTAVLSADADLSALTLADNNGTVIALDSTFASATVDYTANVANEVSSVTVTPTANASASVTVDGTAVIRGRTSAAIDLPVDLAKAIAIVVTAADGSIKTYTLRVTRAVSTQADLSALTISEGTLSPTFAADTLAYTANTGHAETFVTLTPTGIDTITAITVNGLAVESGAVSARVGLNAGANVIRIMVTAEDGTTTKTYTVTVTRGAATGPPVSLVGDEFVTFSLGSVYADPGVTTTDPEATIVTTVLRAGQTTPTDVPNNFHTLSLNPEGVHILIYVVTNTDGASTTITRTITVTPEDPFAPTVDLGSIADGVIGTAQMHDIVFSEPVTGLMLDDFSSTSVTFISVVDTGDQTTYTLTFIPLTAGFRIEIAAYSITDLDGTNTEGPITSDSKAGFAVPANRAPVANAGPDQSVDTGARVTLAGSATDLDTDDNLVYAWAQTGGGTVSLSALDIAAPTFTAPASAATLVFTLTVTDDDDVPLSDTDTVTITVVVPLGLALAVDAGAEADDGFTNNGLVNVAGLVGGGATWKYSTNGGTNFATGSGSNFTLDEGVYAAGAVQVVQTVGGTDSAAASLGAVTIDVTPPTVVFFNDPDDGVIGTRQRTSIRFSEGVTLRPEYLTTDGATVHATTMPRDNLNYQVAFTPSATTYSLTLPVDSIADLAGNTGPASPSIANGSAVADTTKPEFDLYRGLDGGVVGRERESELRFTEDVSGLEISDFAGSTGVTVSDVSVGDRPDSWLITFTPTATAFSLVLAADSVTDGGANTGPTTAQTQSSTATLPPPTIALADDTGASASDGATQNGQVDVTVVTGATWKYLTDGGTTFATGSGGSFTLDEGVYAAGNVQVVQTLDSTDSAAARLGAISVDNTPPVIALNGEASITLTVGDTYTETATVSDNLDAGIVLAIAGDAVDTSSTGTYTVTYAATDAAGNEAVPMTRTVLVPNTAPSITTSAALRHAENDGAAVTTLSATDAEGDTIIWSLTGTDAGLFEIDATSGALTFNTPPNFEDAQDEDGDNSYQVTVTATDDGTPSESSTLEVTVRVTNKNEPGRIGPITGIARVGETLTTGEVTDPDGIITSIEYEWGRALPGERHRSIRGARQRTYTLVADDIGNTIEVFASYQDGFGFDADERDVTSAPTAVVIAETATLSADADLSALTISQGTLVPTFAADTISYAVSVDNDVTSVTLTPTTNHAGASVTVDDATATSGTASAPITLAPGINALDIVVTAQDGTSTKTYTVRVTRVTTPFAVTIPPLGKSTVGNLANVRVTFAQAVTGLTSSDFTATNASLGTLSGSGTEYIVTYTPSAPAPVTLSIAAARVTDADGNPNDAAISTGNATAVATPTTSKPRFVATTTIAGLTTAEFDEFNFVSGIATLLSVPPEDVRVLSIAAGSVVVEYEVVADTVAVRDERVTALSAATQTALRSAIDQNIPSTAAVTTTAPETAAAVAPAAPTLELAVDTGSSPTDGITQNGQVNVMALADSATWKYSVNGGTDFTTGTDSDPDTNVAFFTLPDGDYAAGTVQVVQTLSGTDSAAASLGAVTVDNAAPVLMELTVPAEGVIGTVQDYTIIFDEAVTGLSGSHITGVTTHSVTASDDQTTYTIAFSPIITSYLLVISADSVTDLAGNIGPVEGRSISGDAISIDATLSELEISAGTLSPEFASDTEDYTAGVATAVASVTLTPTTENRDATVTVDGTPVVSGEASAPITLALGGQKAIAIFVTAEDGTTTKTYTVTVTRALSDPPILTISTTDISSTGGETSGTTTLLNASSGLGADTLTLLVESDKPLAGTVQFELADSSNPPPQNLIATSEPNQYQATYTLRDGDSGAFTFTARGVTDALGTPAEQLSFDGTPIADLSFVIPGYAADTSPPVVTLVGKARVSVALGGSYTDAGVTTLDDEDTVVLTIAGPGGATALDTSTAGIYTYTYTVTDAAGNVDDTVTRTVTVGAPGAPSTFSVTALAEGVRLDWEIPSATGSSAITGYQYRQRTASETFSHALDEPNGWQTASAASTYTLTIGDLMVGVEYFFEVRAENSVGVGEASATASATPTEPPQLVLELAGAYPTTATSENADDETRVLANFAREVASVGDKQHDLMQFRAFSDRGILRVRNLMITRTDPGTSPNYADSDDFKASTTVAEGQSSDDFPTIPLICSQDPTVTCDEGFLVLPKGTVEDRNASVYEFAIVNDDGIIELPEKVSFRAAYEYQNTAGNWIARTSQAATLTIENADHTDVNVQTTAFSVEEGVGVAEVVFVLSEETTFPVQVIWEVTRESTATVDDDYTLPESNFVTIVAGETESEPVVISTVDANVNDDSEAEETLIIRITELTANGLPMPAYTTGKADGDREDGTVAIGSANTATITITEPDTARPPTVDFGTIAAGVIGEEQMHDITFSEVVTGLVAADFSAIGATITNLAGSGLAYTITFTPSAATVTLILAADSVVDSAGNPNAEARVTGTNVPPLTANAGPAQRVNVGATVTLDGSGSRGPAAGDLMYAWAHTLTDGVAPTPATATALTDANTATATFTAPNTAGVLVFTLTVTDSVRATASATVTITVNPNTTPTVDLGTITTGVIGTEQTHDITFSEVVTGLADADITGTGATGISVSGISRNYSVTFTPTAAAFTLTLAADSVEDVTGNTGPASAATVTGTAVDTTAPEIRLIGASPMEVDQGATFTDPGATAIDGVDGDLSASIVVGGDLVDTDTSGDYTITYDVSDAAGNAADTVTRIVRVVIVRDLAKLNAVILPEVARSMADQNVSAIVRRLEQARRSTIAGAAASSSFGGAGNLTDIIKAQGRALVDDQFDWKQVLAGSAFVLPLNGAGGGAAEKAQDFTLWGAGDYRSIEGAEGVRWDGNLFSLQLGLDAQLNERTILGVSVSKSQARLGYTDTSLAVSGDYDLDMTSVHPYLGWATGGLDFWATLGYGDGELAISEDRTSGEALPTSDLSMQTYALGASGILMEAGLTTLRLKGEAMSSTVELDGNAQITAVTRDASRLRMTLEATRAQSLDSGAQFESSLEAGLRYDGGDGETGAGAELGTSLRYASLGGGLVIEGKARALVSGKGDAEEWGLSGLFKLGPSVDGRGLSFSLTPGYGVTSSGVQQLWQQGLNDGLGGASHGSSHGASNEYSPSLKVRLDYGMHALRGPGLMTPYTELSLGNSGDTYRLGLHWQRNKLFDLKLVTERKEGTTTADHRIYLEGELAF